MAIPPQLQRVPTTLREQREQRGIATPVQTDLAGRLATSSGADQLRQLLRRAMQDCRNTNPFRQGVGISPAVLFLPKDRATSGLLRAAIAEVFRRDFAGRAALIGVAFPSSLDPGTLVAEVSYRDASTGTNETTSLTFRA